MAQKKRWNNFVIYLLQIRYNKISFMKNRLENRKDLNDTIYISMIQDIYNDQLDFVSRCRSVFTDELDDLNSQ